MTEKSTGTVFLGGPFKGIVDPATGEMDKKHRRRFEALLDRLDSEGHVVHNAHRRESWGAAFLTPEECTRLDFDEISASDVFVAFPGAPASPGTHVELGWASAMGKPVVLLLEPDAEYAFLVRGLHTVADVTVITVGDDDLALADQVSAAVRRAVSGAAG
ncbi:nucleoside 2-deoxyribosyltransferase [Streptomyces sp. RerS4]|uniref:nucleoside 2-deoxyribosyltransferase n=1 Tax=Streptomyces sp. RerS4 TaxID=2942449 RepID=UPI00201C3E36|nr:nucleoside 2-deoxyribosyltransferase [Streptomyces sp. RerS4]UQX03459.1 nucleoside 2-deoxyribosyltransferase [Streptomyces sp. RerS4]